MYYRKMDSVNYIFIGILSFLTFICILIIFYEIITRYFHICKKENNKINKTKVVPFI